jgi:hypothetical protein
MVLDPDFYFALAAPVQESAGQKALPTKEMPVQVNPTSKTRSTWDFPGYDKERYWTIRAEVVKNPSLLTWPAQVPITTTVHFLKEKE